MNNERLTGFWNECVILEIVGNNEKQLVILDKTRFIKHASCFHMW